MEKAAGRLLRLLSAALLLAALALAFAPAGGGGYRRAGGEGPEGTCKVIPYPWP